MRPLVIVNPAAGSSEKVPELSEALRDRADIALTNESGAARHLAAEAIMQSRPLVIAAGGDGDRKSVV